MKQLKLLTMLMASLVLSQNAQSADATSAKNPLTEPEKAQCRAQLTEFNQGVLAYNAELDKLKALRAEVSALNAVIDKDQAVVDRRDSAAMQALNAQIGKNNEMVAQVDQMASSLKAMSIENKQRSAQFSEACENRPMAQAPSPKPQPDDAACGTSAGAKGVERKIEATFVELRADEKKHQAEVDRVADARAKALSWNGEKRAKIFAQFLGSPRFMAFQREKQPQMDELLRILASKPRNGQEECRLIQRIAAMLPSIKAINARQYAFMADEIRATR